MKPFPRPRGCRHPRIITEYELPRFDVRVHDVAEMPMEHLVHHQSQSDYWKAVSPHGVVKEYPSR